MAQKKLHEHIDPKEVSRRFGNDRIVSIFFWSYILLVVIEYSFSTEGDFGLRRFGWPFFLFPVIIGLISFSAFIPGLKKVKWLDNRSWGNLLMVNILLAGLVVFILPLRSPHFMILAYAMFLTVYWKGVYGYLTVLLIQVPALFLGILLNENIHPSANPYYFAAVNGTILMIFGGIVLRLTEIDGIIRQEFEKQSSRINVERERLKSLINSVAVSVIATNRKGIIMLHNDRVHDFVNTHHSIVQKHINDVIDLKDQSGGDVDLVSLVKSESGVVIRDDFHLISDEDQEVAIRMTASPINAKNIHRSDQGYIFLFADVTREKSMDEQRDEFVHLLSHELRTPIAIVEGGISIALEDKTSPLSEEQTKWLNRAHESTVYVSSLLNDLASLTKIDRDNMKTVPMVTRPYNLLRRLVDDYSEQASLRDITLEISDDTTKDRVISSEVHIHEILQNFVSNAIKYTRENTSVTLKAEKSNKGVIFSVADKGKGISKENQKQLFTKYFRSNDSATKQAEGTGLGLYVSTQLAKRVGGQIWVESQLGSGTTFFLEVPNMVEKDKSEIKAKKNPGQ